MLKTIRKLLLHILDNIDNGNSNISEDEAINIILLLKSYTDRTLKLSKYQSCLYLNISRATFDNLVREGKLPKGKKEAGFKELFWEKKELDKYITKK